MLNVYLRRMCRVSVLLLLSVTVRLTQTASGGKSDSEKTCFDQLGCFPHQSPWKEPLRPIPRPSNPESYDANFIFYSRKADKTGTRVDLYPELSQTPSEFKASRSLTVIIVPGTASTNIGGDTTWPIQLKNAILRRVDANILIGNSKRTGHTLDKFLAAANAPVIAKQYTRFINHTKDKRGLEGGRIWIIGFADGAHIAGFVGKDTHIGRITALDPAQELYDGHPPEVRLSKTDADYVDVLHTDSRPLFPDLGKGMMNSIGHVDFYLNGGHQQPGCSLPKPFELVGHPTLLDAVKEPVRLITGSILCAHKLAHRVFIASLEITDCTFWGHPGTYENMLRAISNAGTQGVISKYTALKGHCDLSKCVPLGYDSPKSSARGIFIITTEGDYPYCMDESKTVPQNVEVQKEIKEEQWFSALFQSNKQKEKNIF